MGVLSGIRIVELEGVGPGPFCGMHLADLGADVLVLRRITGAPNPISDAGDATITSRGKRIVSIDLKSPDGVEQALAFIEKADGFIEGMRPGVTERLGLGPDVCLKRNPRLAYGRVTGWGQTGPLSQAAGHDINYIGLSGALWYAGKPGDPPFAPPTLVGDIAGGALYLTIGLLSAVLAARATGQGQVVDAAIVDGTAHMMNLILTLKAAGGASNDRGQSIFDGPHWFDSYRCQDGGFISLGPVEPKFYALLLEKLGLADNPDFAAQYDSRLWPSQKDAFTKLFAGRARQDWCELLEGTDACFAPVLTPDEAALHPHMAARGSYVAPGGVLQGAPAPRFSATAPTATPEAPQTISVSSALKAWS